MDVIGGVDRDMVHKITGTIVPDGAVTKYLGTEPRSAQLILQGSGNSCPGASDFKKFMLRFAGKGKAENLLVVGVPKAK